MLLSFVHADSGVARPGRDFIRRQRLKRKRKDPGQNGQPGLHDDLSELLIH
jgi:hypothetical protein